jgi:hypothetical protein
MPRHFLLSVLAALGFTALGPATASAATLTVTSAGDVLAADGVCTLREAVMSSNAATAVGGCAQGSGNDAIALTVPKITLARPGAGNADPASGDLDVVGTLTITGATGGTIIDAARLDRVFDVTGTGNLTLRDLTVAGGQTPLEPATGPSFAPSGEDGGGIRNAGIATLLGVTVTDNQTSAGADGSGATSRFPGELSGAQGGDGGDGGGIATTGTLTIRGGTIAGNRTGDGGAGAPAFGASGSDQQSAYGGFGGAGGAGGGVASRGTTTIVDAAITGNRTGDGGPGAAGHGGAGRSGVDPGESGARAQGGSGGAGGDGGGIHAEFSTLDVSRTIVSRNATGNGAAGANGYGGSGGNAALSGSGTAAGGRGGEAIGGQGGFGGSGGGISASAGVTTRRYFTVTSSTITANSTGGGADGGAAFGAPGGRARGTTGGRGGDARGSSGGGSGRGGALYVSGSASMFMAGDTVVSNASGSGVGSRGTAVGGPGGNGTAFGADGESIVGTPGQRGGGGLVGVHDAANLMGTIIAFNVPDQCRTSMPGTGTPTNIAFPADADCPVALAVDPQLGPLGDHGGAQPAFSLLPGSPAIDLYTNAGCPGSDQRGVPRPFGSACDAGAYERAPAGVTTGDAVPSATDASVAAAVDARRGTTTVHVVWGTTTAYGSRSADVTVPAGTDGAVAVTFAISGLTPGVTYHYNVVGSGPDGTATGADRTFTTTAAPASESDGGGAAGGSGAATGTGGAGGSPTVAPVLKNLKIAPVAFRAATRKAKKGRGTSITYEISSAATITFTIQRRTTGRRKGATCVAGRKGKRCTRWVSVKGTLTHAAASGRNALKWNGMLAGRTLAPGTYRLTATPKAGTLAGKPVVRTFTIRR